MKARSGLDNLLTGIGLGLLVAASVIKFVDASWVLVSTGVLLLVLGGTGLLSKR
jgi:hypothetical protein